MKITIYGYSDDLIEIEGDIEDEFGCWDEGAYLGFSDGTVLRIRYSPNNTGTWLIERIVSGSATFEHTPAHDEDSDEYSDKVTLTGNVEKYKFAKTLKGAKVKSPTEAVDPETPNRVQ